MLRIKGLPTLKALLSKDLGPSVLVENTFDGWLGSFVNRPAVGVGDMSFSTFASLPLVRGGFLGPEVNTALQAAKVAIATPSVAGIRQPDGERILTAGSDSFRGGFLADRVNAGLGNDVLSMGAGNDTVQGGGGNDLIFGEAGSDSIIGGAGNDTVFGGAERDLLYGWRGNDVLFGGSGNDGLFGNEGNDTISGGDGNDYICGGSDVDVLIGGAGADTFAFRGQAANSVSIIQDFEVLHDRQLIMISVVGGPLTMDMISTYADGLRISFGEGREIRYENVWDASALFASISLFV